MMETGSRFTHILKKDSRKVGLDNHFSQVRLVPYPHWTTGIGLVGCKLFSVPIHSPN